jgi:pimeloyl-ACP methyl ester carboxylesterase
VNGTTVELPSGAMVWYRKQGAGAPVLQIHGSAFGHRNFEKLTPVVVRHFEVIDFDLPGYGESRGGPTPPTMEALAGHVADLVRALGYDRVNVHGTSFGAMIGLTLAATHPEVVDRLVLSCFLARYDRAARMMRGTWKRAARDSGMEAVADLTSVAGFARSFYERPEAEAQLQSMREAFSRTLPEAFVASTETIEGTDLGPLVPRVKAPVLLIAGAEDNMTPLRPATSGVGMRQISEMLPGAETHVIPECGHYLVIEQPEAAARMIQEFLTR